MRLFLFFIGLTLVSLSAQQVLKLDVENIKSQPESQLNLAMEKIAQGIKNVEVYTIAAMASMYLYKHEDAYKFLEQAEELEECKKNSKIHASIYAQKAMAASLIGLQKKDKNEASKHYFQAAELARNAAMLVDGNITYAGYWETYSRLSNDHEQHAVALRYLQSIDPEQSKEQPVMDPVTGTVIVVSLVCATWSFMYTVSEPDQRKLMIQTFPDLANAVISAIGFPAGARAGSIAE